MILRKWVSILFIGITKTCIFFIFYIDLPLQKFRQFFQSFEMCKSGLYWVPNAINQITHFILIPSLPSRGGKILSLSFSVGFPGSSAGKESAHSAEDLGSTPGFGRSPGEGKSYSLQCYGLKNYMDCIVHGVARVRYKWVTKFSLSVSAREERCKAQVESARLGFNCIATINVSESQ